MSMVTNHESLSVDAHCHQSDHASDQDGANGRASELEYPSAEDGIVQNLPDYMHTIMEGIQYVDSCILRIQRRFHLRTLAAITVQRCFRLWKIRQTYIDTLQLHRINPILDISPYVLHMHDLNRRIVASQANINNRYYIPTFQMGTLWNPTKSLLFLMTQRIFRHYVRIRTRRLNVELYLAIPSTRKDVWDLYTLLRSKLFSKYHIPPNFKPNAKLYDFEAAARQARDSRRQSTIRPAYGAGMPSERLERRISMAIGMLPFLHAQNGGNATERRLSNAANVRGDPPLMPPQISAAVARRLSNASNLGSLLDSNESIAIGSSSLPSSTESSMQNVRGPRSRLNSLALQMESELIIAAVVRMAKRRFTPEEVIEMVRERKPALIPTHYRQARRNSMHLVPFADLRHSVAA
ncbi:hypothetical protein HK105_202821 [Polyrhizophydium stewartii]|uniref:Uncharacterized protein n=1 Tax=Polyrhizophydium stewartii TaxID=2732419 RepID=A0ABR4NDC7_9FUNG